MKKTYQTGFKYTFILAITVLFAFSCMQEELLYQNTGTGDLAVDLSRYDHSNLGLYKGTFTTLDATERGTVEVKVLLNVPSRATLTLSSGATYALQSTSVATLEDATNLSFVIDTNTELADTGLSVSFDLSVNADGTNVSISNTSLGGRASHILVVKETSRGLAVGVPGTFDCTTCGTHPSLGMGPQTFNAIFISDPSGEGSSTMETQFTLNGVVFTSPATDNSQDGTSCIISGDFTTCDISGSTTIGPNAMTWAGSHTYNNTATNCSEMSGTWSHPGYSGISGTFVSEIQCLPIEIGDFRDGGVVFWIDPADPARGLVCAIIDTPTLLEWGCFGDDLPNVSNVTNDPPTGLGAGIGDGFENTNNILEDCPTAPAAVAARALGPGWFLPSVQELNEMYVHRVAINATAMDNGGANLTLGNPYWSSTELSNNYAWYYLFQFGNQSNFNKTDTHSVRAVRAFPPPPSQPATIGDFRNGGVVFWVNPLDNTHGLVCAVNDAPTGLEWGCEATDLPSVPNVTNNPPSGLGAEIGDGMANTNGILTDCPTAPAASYARSLGADWFLPSINELNQIYLNRAAINVTATANGGSNFAINWYWSSTEFIANASWKWDFGSGFSGLNAKNGSYPVRAVRAF